jgi:hypothetical protein
LAAQNEINNHFRLLDDLTTVLIQLYNWSKWLQKLVIKMTEKHVSVKQQLISCQKIGVAKPHLLFLPNSLLCETPLHLGCVQ